MRNVKYVINKLFWYILHVAILIFGITLSSCTSTLFISSFKDFKPNPVTGYYSKDFSLYKGDLLTADKINLQKYQNQFCVILMTGYSADLGPIELYKHFIKNLGICKRVFDEKELVDFVLKSGYKKDVFLLDTEEGQKSLAKITGTYLILSLSFQKRYNDTRLMTDLKIIDAKTGSVVFEVNREAPSLGAVGSICDIELAPIFNATIDWRNECAIRDNQARMLKLTK